MAELDKVRTDVMHKAAICLQRFSRGFIERCRYHHIKDAVVLIQVRTHLEVQ